MRAKSAPARASKGMLRHQRPDLQPLRRWAAQETAMAERAVLQFPALADERHLP